MFNENNKKQVLGVVAVAVAVAVPSIFLLAGAQGGYVSETAKFEGKYSEAMGVNNAEREAMELKHAKIKCELEKEIAKSNFLDEANGVATGKDLESLRIKKDADCSNPFKSPTS